MEAHRHPLGRNALPDQILRGDAHPQQGQFPSRDQQAVAVGRALDHALDADQPLAAGGQGADLAAKTRGHRRQSGPRRGVELGDPGGEPKLGAIELGRARRRASTGAGAAEAASSRWVELDDGPVTVDGLRPTEYREANSG